jgi:hypothetical protein
LPRRCNETNNNQKSVACTVLKLEPSPVKELFFFCYLRLSIAISIWIKKAGGHWHLRNSQKTVNNDQNLVQNLIFKIWEKKNKVQTKS